MGSGSSGREKAGLAVIEQLGWGQNEGVRELDEDLWRIVSEANLGTIWARPGLSLRDRELGAHSADLTVCGSATCPERNGPVEAGPARHGSGALRRNES